MSFFRFPPFPKIFLCIPLIALIFVLLVWPLALLAVRSVQEGSNILGEGAVGSGLTLANYIRIVADPLYREALLHSLGLSFIVACSSIFLCLAPAWLFVRKEFPGKRLVRALFALPMSFSGVIVGFLVIIMLGRIGFVPKFFEGVIGTPLFSGAAYQFIGLYIAYVYFEIPRATLTLESSLRKFDFQLEAAARSLGAGRWQRLFFVMLPLMWPALISTFAVTFCVSLGSFGVALIISRRFSLLPLEIYQEFTGFLNNELAAAMSITLVTIAFLVNYSLALWRVRREPVHA